MQMYFIMYIFSLFFSLFLEAVRSPFRKIDDRPVITMKYKKNPKKIYNRSDWYYHKTLFTVFDETFFFNHLLPESGILLRAENNRIPEQVSFEELSHMLESLVKEVRQKRNEYTYFELLQNKNFNRKKKCGLLVVKFKKYPLVAKLFIEHPRTLINPFCKGFENSVFHLMGKGCNRHYAGFTRMINLENLKKRIKTTVWNVIVPRKWFWIPQDPLWIEIAGKNIEKDVILTTVIPGIYIIVADELKENPLYAVNSYVQRHQTVMKFCNEMNLTVDPHIDNFIVEKKDNVLTIGIVDTEHFPTLVGMEENLEFESHIQWYLTLAGKAIKDFFFTSKLDHLEDINKITT